MLACRGVEAVSDAAACWPLIRQLRPLLATEQEFLIRWDRQRAAGYRMVALWDGSSPVALAGYRVQDNLAHGRHLYVDDLVTDEASRGSGHGGVLIAWLTRQARAEGCAKLLLDTPMANSRAHRFYFRQGLLATSLRFTAVLD